MKASASEKAGVNVALEPVSPPPAPAEAFSETVGSLDANLAAVSALAAMGGAKSQNGLETRDMASHIPLSTRANEMVGEIGAVGVTGGVRAERRLTAEVQAELARLGCYDGPQDNIWGASSAKAMRRLGQMVRLRARSSEPDVALLNELKGVSEPVCKPGRGQADGGQKSGQAASPHSSKIQDRLPILISPAAVGLPDGGKPGASAARQGGGGSYLPPWMQAETMANAQAGQSVDGRPVDDVQAAAKKRAAAHARARREWRERMRRREEQRSAWRPFF